MNKNDFSLLLEEWNSFLLKDTSKEDFNFNLFLESCIQLEKEIDIIRESLILENNNLKDVYRLNEIGLIDNFKKALSGFKFRKDSGEKINPDDSESQNKQVLTKTSKAIMILFITLKCSQAFAPTAHIDVNEFKAKAPIAHEITDSDIKAIKNMPDDKIKDLAKSLPPAAKDDVKSKVKQMVTKEVKKEVKKIKVNKAKVKNLKSKKARAKATNKIKKAAQEIVKKTKKVVDEVKKIGEETGMGYDLKSIEEELMSDPDIKDLVRQVKNSPHGESGEPNVINVDISKQTVKIKQAFKAIKGELNKSNISGEMKIVDKISNHNNLSAVDDALEDASGTTVRNLIQVAKVHAFKKAFDSYNFEKDLTDYKTTLKFTEKTIDGKDSSDTKLTDVDGSNESAFLTWLLQNANTTNPNHVLHSDYDAPGDGAYDMLVKDLIKNAKETGINPDENQYFQDFLQSFEKVCFALGSESGYEPSQPGIGYDKIEELLSYDVETAQLHTGD